MRLFAAGGRRQQALGQYHQLREALSARSGGRARPSDRRACIGRCCAVRSTPTRRSGRRAWRGRARGAARAAEPARHNLPIALTSFIGRDRELREVARLLDRNRLVTLTGAGGSGKTRLALEAATARRGRVPATASGWWSWRAWATRRWCRTRPPPRSGSRFPLSARPSRASAPSSASGAALLILDNCEHLIARLRRPGRAPAGRLPGAAYPGHEPRAAARPRRGDLAGPVADAARPGSVGGARGAGRRTSRFACSASARATSRRALR